MREGVPAVVGDYRLSERLGGGGFGDVYAATHTVIGGDVAIKILHTHRCTDPSALRRFVDEARAVNQIRHPAIVDIFDFGTLDDGRQYLVMERIRGQTLREILDAGRIQRDRALAILRGIAVAVDAAHAAGIAHRDLKPDNVFVLPGGEIKLIDFGLAKLGGEAGVTETGAVMGTPLYMAPEQCRGNPADTRSDLYSFGAVAYQVLTGTRVFTGDPLALALQHLNDLPDRPSQRASDLPRGTDAALLALLAKDPASRPAPLVDVIDRLVKPRRPWKWFATSGVVVAIAAFALVPVAKTSTTPGQPIDPRTLVIWSVPLKQRLDNYPSLSQDGKQLVFASHSVDGDAVVDVATGELAGTRPGTRYETHLHDGRALWSGDDAVDVEDSHAPGGRRKISSGTWGEASPCDARVAVLVDSSRLITVDADSGDVVKVGAGGPGGARWSPDCRRLVWATADSIVHVADLESSRVRDLKLPILAGQQVLDPVAFLGPDTLIYCGDIGGTRGLMLFDLANESAADTYSWMALDQKLHKCTLASAGSRAVVTEYKIRWSAALIDVTAEHSTPRYVDEGFAKTLAFADNATLVVGRPDGKVVNLSPSETTAARSCGADIQVLRYRGTIVQVERRDDTLRFFDGACSPIGTWKLPAADRWSYAACAETRCVIAALAGDRVKVYELLHDTVREVAAFDSGRSGTGVGVALSPDGNTAIANRDLSNSYTMISFEHGTSRTVELGNGRDPATMLGGFAWAPDGKSFYMNATNLDEGGYGVFRISSLDGKRELVFNSVDSPAGVVTVSPDGKSLAVIYGTGSEELDIVDVGTTITLRPVHEKPSPRGMLPPVAFAVHNRRARPINLVWVDPDGKRQQYATIPPGVLMWQRSFAGHEWIVREGATDLGVFTVPATAGTLTVGDGDEGRLATVLPLQPPFEHPVSASGGLGGVVQFVNRREHAIDLWKADASGELSHVAREMAGQTFTLGTSEGEVWVVREGERDLGVVVGKAPLGRVEIR